MIDTHAHLDDERFRDDLPEVLARAQAAGVTAAVVVGTDAPTNRRCVQLAQTYPMLYATVGIQPNHAAEAAPGDWDAVVALASQARVVALGETGLDRYWDRTPFAQQEDYFARHLALARTTGLPVVIHNREADADVVRMLRDDFDRHGPVAGVMHSFATDAATAEACVAMGLYISFAGMLTYKNAAGLRQAASTLAHDRLLVETDSPYLSPVPHRGKRNEPAHVKHTLECLAECVGLTATQLDEITTRNAQRLFRLQ